MKVLLEGYADTEPGWEFDMPTYLIQPVRREFITGSADPERVVEEYMIAVSLGEEWKDEPHIESRHMNQFYRARQEGDTGRFVYWSCEVRWPDDLDTDDVNNWFRIVAEEIKQGEPG